MADRDETKLNKAEEKQQQEARLAAEKNKAGIGRSRKVHSENPKMPGKPGEAADGSTGDEAESNAELNERMKSKLCTAVNVALGAKCLEIVKGLMKKTIAGDVRCATLLFALAEPSDKNASVAAKRWPRCWRWRPECSARSLPGTWADWSWRVW